MRVTNEVKLLLEQPNDDCYNVMVNLKDIVDNTKQHKEQLIRIMMDCITQQKFNHNVKLIVDGKIKEEYTVKAERTIEGYKFHGEFADEEYFEQIDYTVVYETVTKPNIWLDIH